MRRFVCLAWAICVVVASAGLAPAATEWTLPLESETASNLFSASAGTLNELGDREGSGIRWSLAGGESGELSLLPDSAPFQRLRYFDRLQFEYRVTGEIDSFGFRALGHVSGARQYKEHQWNIAIRTTPVNVWHPCELDLTRPSWFPWDNPDGLGSEGFFAFTATAIAPGTAIELRKVRLVRSAVLVKPFYEMPVTWPVKTENADGGATYRLEVQALNISGRPATIEAVVRSEHRRFHVAILTNRIEVKSAKLATFVVQATISAADRASAPELYSEPLRVGLRATEEPEAETVFEARLVRPLGRGIRRQVVMSASDLAFVRDRLAAGDTNVVRALDLVKVRARADEFKGKQLREMPGGHAWPGSRPAPEWRITDVMPEIENRQTGERQMGTELAGLVWKQYLDNIGGACESLGLAYLCTGDEAYARKAVELFRLYARSYGELRWGYFFELPWLAGHSVLGSSRVASGASYGSNIMLKGHCRLLSMIADYLEAHPDDRDAIYTGFVVPYAAELCKMSRTGGIHNQTDISNHNLCLLGIVFDDAGMLYDGLMTDAGLRARITDIDSQGFSSEGRPLNYHFSGMVEYLPSVLYIVNSGLPVELETGRLLEAMRMPYSRVTLTGQGPASGDCGRGNRVGPQPLAAQLLGLFPKEEWLLDAAGPASMQAKLHALRTGRTTSAEAYRRLIDSDPKLFRESGFAILRSGRAVEEQVMATLDYGRAFYHVGLNRNQITLSAYGAVFSQDPGSIYNVGKGGYTANPDPKLAAFFYNHTMCFNVIAVDASNQQRAIGRLLAWSPGPDRQVAVSRVDGAYPGVSHTRALVLEDNLVVLLDRLESADEHTYDFIYRNFGALMPGPGWSGSPAAEPLARTLNYESIGDLRRLSGDGPIRLGWDMAGQFPTNSPAGRGAVGLALWQLPVEHGEVFTGIMGMNNPNTATIPDAAPALIHRVRGRSLSFATILEPWKRSPRVTAIRSSADGEIAVERGDAPPLRVSMGDLLQRFPVR